MSETSVRNDVSSESLCTVIENCTENNNLLSLKTPQHHVKLHDNDHNNQHDNQHDNKQEHHHQHQHEPSTFYNDDVIYKQHNTKFCSDEDDYDDDSKDTESGICDEESIRIVESHEDLRKLDSPESTPSTNGDLLNNSLESNCDSGGQSGQDQVDDAGSPEPQPISQPPPVTTKLKKSVSFDPTDEKVRKFIVGEPIVDQRNPFKHQTSPNASLLNGKAKKKTPPPVPARRSTLSVRKTVTQQLREREREKEKDRERAKNDANQRRTSGVVSSPSDEFITTEEVLKQSKYVKTYIKNPDPVFVYDPTVLARIKFEELRELADKKPPKKLKLSTQTRDRLRDVKPPIATKPVTFKKCSKPNYPELSDIKVRCGPEATDDEPSFNPAEVTKNAKKFDERVKKLLIGSNDDLDEIDEPLTKSESSDEVTLQAAAQRSKDETDGGPADIESPTDHKNLSDLEEDPSEMKAGESQPEPSQEPCGTFTNTIKSKEFQEYLDKKGLSLIPKKIPAGAQAVYTVNGGVKQPRSNNHITFAPSPERVQLSINRMAGDDGDSDGGKKKPSVFQRLLAHSIFASRRKTTPKETVPMPRRIGAYGQVSGGGGGKEPNGIVKTPSPIRRVVLERQSFHGRPRASNLLTTGELRDLKNQTERSRKSFASGDDLSLSISSALTNAEDGDDTENTQPQQPVPQPRRSAVDQLARPMVKPPRRSVSKDRLPNGHYQDSLSRTKVPLPGSKAIPLSLPRSPNEGLETAMGAGEPMPIRRATLERQSLIPRRTATPNSVAERRQVFGRTASMDRNEILKRNTNRGPPRSRSALGTAATKLTASTPVESRDNLEESQFSVMNGPKMTSTPIRDQGGNQQAERKSLAAMAAASAATRHPPPGVVYVDPQEWERLRAIKERTDKELYYKMMQHQQQQQQQRPEADRIYEKVPQTQVIVEQHQPPATTAATMNGGFVRGSPQRNTFSGVMPQRLTKINDGRAIMTPAAEANERSQSVLDGMTLAGRRNFRRGYESENETPVIMRRQKGDQPGAGDNQQEPRRIGGLLTREEILAKVKEFCRKSLNKTPQPAHMQAIYEKQTDLSPVSYASVETQHLRPGSRMYAAPQVPQRFQSLQPQQFIPIQSTHEVISQRPMAPIQQQMQQQFIDDPSGTTTTTTTTAQLHPNPSPIYAHVIKRSSLQSNQSGGTADLYDTPQPIRQYIVRRDSEAAPLQPVYITHPSAAGSVIALQQQRGGENGLAPAQYVIVDSEKLSPRQVYNYYQTEVYAQPQYIRPHQVLQPIAAAAGAGSAAPYGYISVREPAGATVVSTPQQQQHQHQLRARLLDGRSTPLILDRSSQQASQIYWTPQHQRLQQQHTGLMPLHISPRYTMKQSATMSPAVYGSGGSGQQANLQRFSNVMQHEQLYTINPNIPQQQQQQQHQHQQQQQHHQQQQQHHQQSSMDSPSNNKQQMMQRGGSGAARKIDDWESGSEAGEVQRIMEQQNKNGECSQSSPSIFKNLRSRMARLIAGGSRRF